MKAILVAFYLFMVVIYLGIAGILIFTGYFPYLQSTTRLLLGLVLAIYAFYRGFSIYRNIIKQHNNNRV